VRGRSGAWRMRILVWNMGNGGPGNSEERHDRAWRYLGRIRSRFDVALLQETREPGAYAERYGWSVVWSPKYASGAASRSLWGSAVVARGLALEPFRPRKGSALATLGGSTAIARVDADPRWLASVHLHDRPITDQRLLRLTGVPRGAPKGLWETDVIPFKLRRLFGTETFVWGGDLNSAESMDDVSWFVGGNRRLREIWEAAGSVDLRKRIHAEEQRTYFAPRRAAYQLDHVFADPKTASRVLGWHVNPRPAARPDPLSDHAPIVVELETRSRRAG
jgi:hypothetical protein